MEKLLLKFLNVNTQIESVKNAMQNDLHISSMLVQVVYQTNWNKNVIKFPDRSLLGNE